MTDLISHIRGFVPDCAEGEEMELRTSLVVARDYAAMLRTRVGSEWALILAAEAHTAAGDHAFAETSLDRLRLARDYCRNLVQASLLADWLESGGATR